MHGASPTPARKGVLARPELRMAIDRRRECPKQWCDSEDERYPESVSLEQVCATLWIVYEVDLWKSRQHWGVGIWGWPLQTSQASLKCQVDSLEGE